MENEDKKVCVINGEWGVGKTVFFSSFIEKYREQLARKYEDYSYISLFGVNESLELNSKIIYETRELQTFTSPYFRNSKDKIGTIQGLEKKCLCEKMLYLLKRSSIWIWRKGKKVFNYLWRLKGVIQYLGGISPPKYFLIKKKLICFDDIERIGKDFSIEELLGTIDELTNQRQCKVFIIFNRDQLEDDSFQKYREKVVDLEITYAPSCEDNFDVAFNGTALDDDWRNIASERCLQLKIDNIRVLKKIRFALENYDNRADEIGFPNIVRDTFIRRLVSFYSLYLEEKGDVYTDAKKEIFSNRVDFDDACIPDISYFQEAKIKIDNEDKLLSDLLKKYFLCSSFALDYEIIFYINHGYTSPAFIEYGAWCERSRREENALKFKEKKEAVSNLYHSTLADNLDEIIVVLNDLIKDDIGLNSLGITEFIQFIKEYYFFHKLKDSTYSVETIYSYIDKYIELNELHFLSVDIQSIIGSITITSVNRDTAREEEDEKINNYVIRKIEDVRATKNKKMSTWGILYENYNKSESFSFKEREQLLSQIKKDEFLEIFEKYTDPKLTVIVREAYRDLKSFNKADEIDKALNEIEQKSTFNAYRVEELKNLNR